MLENEIEYVVDYQAVKDTIEEMIDEIDYHIERLSDTNESDIYRLEALIDKKYTLYNLLTKVCTKLTYKKGEHKNDN